MQTFYSKYSDSDDRRDYIQAEGRDGTGRDGYRDDVRHVKNGGRQGIYSASFLPPQFLLFDGMRPP
jgi:hypothetical protein